MVVPTASLYNPGRLIVPVQSVRKIGGRIFNVNYTIGFRDGTRRH
jgi:hypothetical protein